YVRKIEAVEPDSIRVQRLMDEGYDVVQSSLPVLLTVVKELNEPRLPSLKGKMAAKKAGIKKLGMTDILADENDLGLKGSPTQVKNIFAPEARTDRKMLEGSPEDQVETLLRELRGLKCL
ncbi:MAG: electron transfer flavoprotein subunit beta, partial [Nitrospirota bacterium]